LLSSFDLLSSLKESLKEKRKKSNHQLFQNHLNNRLHNFFLKHKCPPYALGSSYCTHFALAACTVCGRKKMCISPHSEQSHKRHQMSSKPYTTNRTLTVKIWQQRVKQGFFSVWRHSKKKKKKGKRKGKEKGKEKGKKGGRKGDKKGTRRGKKGKKKLLQHAKKVAKSSRFEVKFTKKIACGALFSTPLGNKCLRRPYKYLYLLYTSTMDNICFQILICFQV
jgi:hypothetical protein